MEAASTLGSDYIEANTRRQLLASSDSQNHDRKGKAGKLSLRRGVGCVGGKKVGLCVGCGVWMTFTLAFFGIYVVCFFFLQYLVPYKSNLMIFLLQSMYVYYRTFRKYQNQSLGLLAQEPRVKFACFSPFSPLLPFSPTCC